MNSHKIKALLVDDELEACENLHRAIQELDNSIEILGYAHNTEDAEQIILTEQPDLIFLDIEMPNETGIEFLSRIAPVQFETVFVTAFDDYAIKAFKLNALDYVLKPLKKDYLKKTLDRIKELIKLKNDNTSSVPDLLSDLHQEPKTSLVLRTGAEVHYLKFNEIIFLKADGSYSRISLLQKEKFFTASYPIGHYEEILPTNFSRVHRSYIINTNYITHLKVEERNHFIILQNDIQIPISRRRYKSFKEKLSKS